MPTYAYELCTQPIKEGLMILIMSISILSLSVSRKILCRLSSTFPGTESYRLCCLLQSLSSVSNSWYGDSQVAFRPSSMAYCIMNTEWSAEFSHSKERPPASSRATIPVACHDVSPNGVLIRGPQALTSPFFAAHRTRAESPSTVRFPRCVNLNELTEIEAFIH